MIFVTVGTTSFDGLVETVDAAVGNGAIAAPVLLQIGSRARYVPRFCRYFTGAPTLAPFYRSCSLVVGHGGTGTTLEVLMMGKPLISVANPALDGAHQNEFLAALDAQGWVSYCRNLNDLPAMINQRRAAARSVGPGRQLAAALSRELETLVPSSRTERWFARLAGSAAARLEIDPARTDRGSVKDDHVWNLVRTPATAILATA